jgi:hypothetical protein
VLTRIQKPSLACFINRVAAFPERLQYIYFDTVLLLRAVARIAPYLSSYDYCSTNDAADDAHTLEKLSRVTDIARRVGRFDETVLFRGENANVGLISRFAMGLCQPLGAVQVLREEFKTHFRNVSRIMDCVGCDKCRLWGKVQFTGIATAMKILFELDETAFEYVTAPAPFALGADAERLLAPWRTHTCCSARRSSPSSTRCIGFLRPCTPSTASGACGRTLTRPSLAGSSARRARLPRLPPTKSVAGQPPRPVR